MCLVCVSLSLSVYGAGAAVFDWWAAGCFPETPSCSVTAVCTHAAENKNFRPHALSLSLSLCFSPGPGSPGWIFHDVVFTDPFVTAQVLTGEPCLNKQIEHRQFVTVNHVAETQNLEMQIVSLCSIVLSRMYEGEALCFFCLYCRTWTTNLRCSVLRAAFWYQCKSFRAAILHF